MKSSCCLAPIVDRHGRAIEIGDVLKVFHFIGPRGKKHYMYKIVGEKDGDIVMFDACDIADKWKDAHSCPLDYINHQGSEYYEIIAGYNGVPFDERPKLVPLDDGEGE